MYLKELLMWLYKRILFLVLFILVSGCVANIFSSKDLYNNIFVNDISERRGLVIRSYLLEYFPNRDYSNIDYVIDVETKKNSNYYLTDKAGFGSRNRITITATWSVTYKPTGKVLLKISNTYIESYNIERIGQANIIAEKTTEDSLSKTIAQDIALKTFSLMLKIKKNPYLLGTKISDNQAFYELFDTFDAFQYDVDLSKNMEESSDSNTNDYNNKNLIPESILN